MVPNFALSLSFEGITLLRRMGDRWARIEEVALDSGDFEAAVIGLRDRAEALDPDGAQVMLVIPNEQIRYLDMPDLGGDDSARTEAIKAALDGATPYAVADLRFDHTVTGGRLHIAAVAQETLDEAEAFGTQHGFTPVSFVAIAPEGGFPEAVFFGPAQGMDGTAARPPQPLRIVAADEAALTPVAPAETAAEKTAQETAREAKAPDPQEGTPAPNTQVETPPAAGAAQASDSAQDAAKGPASTETPAKPKPAAADTPAPGAAQAGAKAQEGTGTPAAQDGPTEKPKGPGKRRKGPPTQAGAAPKDGGPAKTPKEDGPAKGPKGPPAAGPAAKGKPGTPGSKDGTVEPPMAPAARKGKPGEMPAPVAFSTVRASREAGDIPPAPRPLTLTGGDGTAHTPRFTPVAGAKPADKTDKSEGGRKVTDAALAADTSSADEAGRGGTTRAAMNLLARGGEKARRRLSERKTPPPPAIGTESDEAPKPDPRPRPNFGPGAEDTAPPPAAARSAGRADNPLSRLAAYRANPDRPAGVPAGAALAGTGATLAPEEERERMTVFGARREQRVGGKPRFLGLMLTAALLIFLAGVAAWASVFLDDGLSSLFRKSEPRAVASLPDAQQAVDQPRAEPSDPAETPETTAAPLPEVTVTPEATGPEETTEEPLQIAALETGPAASDATEGALADPEPPRALSAEEAAATYAATGIWQRTPVAPHQPPQDGVDEVYRTSIDPDVQIFDAVALPRADDIGRDPGLEDPGLPPPSDLSFDFDDRGLIRATPEGALTPEGLRIYTGRPPVVPPARPGLTELRPELSDDPEVNPLGAVRPQARPDDLVEQRERATLGGISVEELASIRPVMRPRTVQEEAAEADPEATATAQAVRESLVPVARPRNMAAIVRRAEERQARQPEPVQTASIAPRAVRPSVPSSASVASAATVQNAINLRRINVIGIYGTPSNRRALVRLANGNYKKVQVGDRLDGGRVASIGDDDLRYVKSGRSITLEMPDG
ncbi:hypothetical protein AVJ23_05625 [Pseudoponticoccus marisrubri]|uniref:Translation initiation factor 2 n=2 Tax=Pseudoponticoccus marisrubri TaxID=1685382 RepID=A0A0W7WNH4_9RHOB|nr:hypothetical protein AVJ23_05625 [Pseudoponticoccus marisrubri]